MKVLVCGGRAFDDYEAVSLVLRRYINPCDRHSIVIQGGAKGADALAKRWCLQHGVHCAQVDAQWNRLGRSAGPSRNRAMLLLGPEIVIAFPGGAGTESMVGLAKDIGFEVLRYVPPEKSASPA